MTPETLKKVDYHIAIWGAIAIALALVIDGWLPMLSATTGALLGMVNWIGFRKVIRKLMLTGDRMGLGLFLGIKFTMILAAITLLFLLTPIQPIAFTIGISALFFGISSGYITNLLRTETTALRGED